MTELAAALQAETAALRWQAIAKLNETPGSQDPVDPVTLAALVKALADDHPFVRWQAGQALARERSGRQRLIEVLKGEADVPASAEGEDKSRLVRSAAIDALRYQKLPEISALLVDALRRGDVLLRQSAAEALANHGDPSVVPHLATVARQDENPWVRRAAVYALGCLKHKEAAVPISECLADKAVVVRRSAAYALGALRAETGLGHLRLSLTDADPQVRRNAAWALGRIGRPEIVPDLKRLLDDTSLDGTVAATAFQALQAITRPRWLQVLVGASGRFRRDEYGG